MNMEMMEQEERLLMERFIFLYATLQTFKRYYNKQKTEAATSLSLLTTKELEHVLLCIQIDLFSLRQTLREKRIRFQNLFYNGEFTTICFSTHRQDKQLTYFNEQLKKGKVRYMNDYYTLISCHLNDAK